MNTWSAGTISFLFFYSFTEADKWDEFEEKLRFTKLTNWIVHVYGLREPDNQNRTMLMRIAEHMHYYQFRTRPGSYQDANYMAEPIFHAGLFVELITRYPTLFIETNQVAATPPTPQPLCN